MIFLLKAQVDLVGERFRSAGRTKSGSIGKEKGSCRLSDPQSSQFRSSRILSLLSAAIDRQKFDHWRGFDYYLLWLYSRAEKGQKKGALLMFLIA